MDRILQIFKEYDIDVLLAKKALVSSELKKNKELQDKLEKMMERIEKEIEIVRNMEYESDWTPDVGLEPTTTGLKVLRSTDWANRV